MCICMLCICMLYVVHATSLSDTAAIDVFAVHCRGQGARAVRHHGRSLARSRGTGDHGSAGRHRHALRRRRARRCRERQRRSSAFEILQSHVRAGAGRLHAVAAQAGPGTAGYTLAHLAPNGCSFVRTVLRVALLRVLRVSRVFPILFLLKGRHVQAAQMRLRKQLLLLKRLRLLQQMLLLKQLRHGVPASEARQHASSLDGRRRAATALRRKLRPRICRRRGSTRPCPRAPARARA